MTAGTHEGLALAPGIGPARLAEERLRRRLARAEEAQLVRSPVAGRVAEVKVRDLRPGEVVVEVIVLSTLTSEK
jgi:hypothetical protein